MIRVSRWALAAAVLIAAGCGGASTSPLAPGTAPAPTGAAQLGGSAWQSDSSHSALALFTITVDPTGQTAVSQLKETRSGQQTDDVYELAIGNFITSDTLKVESVESTAQAVELHYSVTHPFKAPTDLDAVPTKTNRADLAVSGRVAFLVDVADALGNSYFTGDDNVVANTSLVSNADGYYTPGGLLNLSGFTANTFPYKVLVDETLDPRVAQSDGLPRSNAGSSTGNYNPLTGWQRDTMGPLFDSWAGYGVMHHGQTVHNTLTLDRSLLESGERFSFDAAIIVKYEDPRGGLNSREKRGNRLPPATADIARFVYREPHGALDIERIRFEGEDGTFLTNQLSGSELRFRVVDWDARATTTTFPDLSEDLTSASTVAAGEAGAPTLAVCIPGVLGDTSTVVTLTAGALSDDDTLVGGDLTAETGLPGDGLYYSETVSKTVLSGQTDGTYVGLVRATDVEDALGTPMVIALQEDLAPVTVNLPRPVAFQKFTVNMSGGSGNMTPSLVLTTPANVTSGTGTAIVVSSYNDLDGDNITVEIDWDNNGTYEDTQILTGGSGGGQNWSSPISYTNPTLVTQTRTIPVRFTDGVIASPQTYSPALSFLLGPNQAPGAGSLSLTTPASVTSGSSTTVSVVSASDPEGDAIFINIDWDNNSITPADQRTLFAPYSPVMYTSPITYTAAVSGETRTIPVSYGDAGHAPVAYSPALSFSLISVSGGLPSVTLSTPSNVQSGTTTTIDVVSASDPDGNPISFSIDWDNDPQTAADVRVLNAPYNAITYTSPATYKNGSLAPTTRTIPVSVTDGVNPWAAYTPALSFTLGPNRAPIVAGTPALAATPVPAPATFTMLAGTATATDPEGDAISYTIVNNQDANSASGAFPFTGLGPYNSPIISVIFTVYANDPLHPTTFGSPYPNVTGLVQCDPQTLLHQWTFDTGMDGFVLGQNYSPVLVNNDDLSSSQFARCAAMGYMGAGISGSALTTGGNIGICGAGINTYGGHCTNNVVSPLFSLAGKGNAKVVFNAVRNGKTGSGAARYRVYVSTNGSAWTQLLNELGGNTIPNTTLNQEVSLASVAGASTVRVRFEFWDNGSATFTSGVGTYAGWTLDDVRIIACP